MVFPLTHTRWALDVIAGTQSLMCKRYTKTKQKWMQCRCKIFYTGLIIINSKTYSQELYTLSHHTINTFSSWIDKTSRIYFYFLYNLLQHKMYIPILWFAPNPWHSTVTQMCIRTSYNICTYITNVSRMGRIRSTLHVICEWPAFRGVWLVSKTRSEVLRRRSMGFGVFSKFGVELGLGTIIQKFAFYVVWSFMFGIILCG